MIDGIAGIVLKLNTEYEDLETYLQGIRKSKCYNVPKIKNKPGYKYLVPDQWLMIYDPGKEAITVVGKVMKQKDDPDNPEFPCFNYFDPANLHFPGHMKLRLRFLERVFDNFRSSRRYRNISDEQFDRLMAQLR
ncbi:MAG: hypothetical protein ABR915_21325 [Thermoguttaceae bacterium]